MVTLSEMMCTVKPVLTTTSFKIKRYWIALIFLSLAVYLILIEPVWRDHLSYVTVLKYSFTSSHTMWLAVLIKRSAVFFTKSCKCKIHSKCWCHNIFTFDLSTLTIDFTLTAFCEIHCRCSKFNKIIIQITKLLHLNFGLTENDHIILS